MRLIITLFALMLVGCSPKGAVQFVSFDKIRPLEINSTGIDLEMSITLSNSFKKKVTAHEAEFEIINSDRAIAVVKLLNPIVLQPRSSDRHTVKLRIRLSQGALSEVMTILSRPTPLTIRGTVKGQMGILKKKIRFEQVVTGQNKNELIKKLRKELNL